MLWILIKGYVIFMIGLDRTVTVSWRGSW